VNRRPELKCINKNSAEVIDLDSDGDVGDWFNAPSWSGPSAGEYNNIRVRVDRDEKTDPCHKLEANCEGKITIIGNPIPSSSSYTPPPPQSSSSSAPVITPSSSSKAVSSSSAASGGGVCGEGQGNMCLWNAAGDCWPVNSADEKKNCGKNGWLFQGGDQGEGTACKNGTFICGKDNNPPAGGATSLGCCKWASETKCYNIYTQKEKDDCSGSSTDKYWSQACPDKNGGCPP